MTENEAVMDGILDAGEMLLTAGAEVSRVEDTMRRLSRAYGFKRTDVFTITSSMVVTIHTADGDSMTQTRRIIRRETDMYKIERVNALSRSVCKNPIPPEKLKQELEKIQSIPTYSAPVMAVTYVITAAAFAVFFGGAFRDGAAAGICGLVLFAVITAGNRISLQPVVQTIFASAAMCLTAFVLVRLGLGQSANSIIIGNIMLLIPGVPLMTSVRDMIMGDTITGALGVCEAIIRAMAIAMGCAIVLLQFGRV